MIHQELADLVVRTGLTRAEFARRLGVGAPQVSNWLNGRVAIPAHHVEHMRGVLAELLGDASVGNIARARRAVQGEADADWRFIHANVNAGKDFGNAGIYATPQSIPSLVRETGQNSLDAAVGGAVTLRYTLFEMSPGSRRHQRFLEAIRYQETLAPHVRAAAESGGGSNKIGVRLKAALRAIERGETLRVLRVEDFGARGLAGGEHDSTQPFSALVRDNLNSRKAQATAGGVFGIGSKTLWACSRLSTVLFSTIIHGEDDGEQRVRVIGKTDLAYHEDEEGSAFAGAGWFGAPVGTDGAESLWLEPEDDLLEDLLLARTLPEGEERDAGTTALILAFHDPKADDDGGEAIVTRFASAIAENFWPAMVAGQLVAHVEHVVDDEPEPRSSSLVEPDAHVPAFADALRKHKSGDVCERLEKPGDVVSVPISFNVPATRPEGGVSPAHGPVDAECRLVIRLADPATSSDRWVDHVGYARGRAMIVKYERRAGVVTGARPFHAVLLAGTLAGAGSAERHAEQFLRFAEPTAHDDWALNGDLKERYAHGAGARIRALHEQVVKALQKYVRSEATTSSDGPAVLKELFSLRVPTPPARKAKWTLRNVHAKPVHGAWEVQGEVIVEGADADYVLVPRAGFDPESGRPLAFAWETLASQDAIVDGQVLRVRAGTRKIRFTGRTAAGSGLAQDRCVLRLDVQFVAKGGQS